MDDHPLNGFPAILASAKVQRRVEPCADDGLPYKLTGCLPEDSWPSDVAGQTWRSLSLKRGEIKRERWTMNGILPSGKLT